MDALSRIKSTAEANAQIQKQQDECHYVLHNAFLGKGAAMKINGFQDFDLLYGAEKAKSKLELEINCEVKSTVYVKVTYSLPKHRVGTLGYFTWSEFQNIPKDWAGFKKFKTAYEKAK